MSCTKAFSIFKSRYYRIIKPCQESRNQMVSHSVSVIKVLGWLFLHFCLQSFLHNICYNSYIHKMSI